MDPLFPLHSIDAAALAEVTSTTPAVTVADLRAAAIRAQYTARSGAGLTPRAGQELARTLLGATRRLLVVTAALTDHRAVIVRHVASADFGDAPAPCDLLDALARFGHPLTASARADALALHAAEEAARW